MSLSRPKSLVRRLPTHRKGFTFVETLIAFSIVGIFLALTWATLNFLLLKAGEQIERTRAHFLATEGIELVKQIRQTGVNRDRETGFSTSIGKLSGSFVVSPQGSEFELVPGSNEKIEMNEEPFTTYCRTLDLSGEGETSKVVTSTVRWGDATDCSLGDQIVSYSTLLADQSH
jgi:prepilin-type N-terminal cleavage/methylation domain-containing protein